MADPQPEGWGVPTASATRILIAVPLVLLAMLSLAAWFYEGHLKPARARPVTPFPAPGIETYVHPGQGDPDMPAPHPSPDPHVQTAAREVAAEGLPGWPSAARAGGPGR